MPAVTSTSSGDYKQPQVGMQPGGIFKIIDLGTQEYEYQGAKKIARQLVFGFELPEDTTDDNKPLQVTKKISLTIGDRATLTKLAIACGEPKPALGFDPVVLAGKFCNLNLTSWTKNDKSGVNIESFAPLMKSQKVPALYNNLVVFDLDKFDQDTFDGLNDYYKEMIVKSPEYIELKSGKQDYAKAKAGNIKQPQSEHVAIDDNIPF